MHLGDLGADVVKVERPHAGDSTRAIAPPLWNGESCYFLSVNRNKRSIALNLKHAQGREVAHQLAARADVMIEALHPGAAESLGLDYETLESLNPRLVYCKITGFGRTGPASQRPAMDVMMQAWGGLMSVTGEAGGRPVRVGYSLTDVVAGLNALVAVLSALHVREMTGVGQLVDTSLLEGQVLSALNFVTNYLATGEVPQPSGSGHPSVVPYQAFPASDGFIVVAGGNDTLWRRMCRVLGRDELADDPRFRTNPDRVQNRTVLIPMLEDVFRGKRVTEWQTALDEMEVPNAPVNTIDRVLADPQVAARDMIVPIPHPRIPELRVPGIPFKLSRSQPSIRRPPPLLGEHSDEVLAELGYDAVERVRLREAGVYHGSSEEEERADGG